MGRFGGGALEANNGANWYLQTRASSAIKASLKLSASANGITLKRLIRKGIPLVLRPKIWFALSGAAKKKWTVPESYYDDFIKATEGMATAATKQIDQFVDPSVGFASNLPWLDRAEGYAALRRVLDCWTFVS